MSQATLWVLFVANACAFIALVLVAVRSSARVDYSIYIPPTTDESVREIDLRSEADVPTPRVELDQARVQQPHATSGG